MVDEPTVEPDLPEARSATTYTVTPSNTWIYVVVRFDPQALAVALGHDHMVRATRYRSSIVWHPEDASQCDVSFTIPVADLVPDPPGGRKRAGLDELDAVAEKTLGTIQSNFQGKKQLNMAEYPEIRFQSTSCSGTSGAVTVTGELTMRGVTNAISIPMTVDEDGDQFRASGQFTTTHTAFGFKPFSNMAGAFRNLDTLSFAIDVVAAAK
jgi:polyisoprenoid-binding protein YceI